MKKRLLAVFTVICLVAVLIPGAAFAATEYVQLGDKILTDGENTVGSGTATWDKANHTLTLDGVSATGLHIYDGADFTVNVKGNTTIGTETSRTNGSSLWTTWSTGTFELNVNIEQGAELSIYTANGNCIYNKGAVNVSGSGTLTGDTSGGYPGIYAEGDLNLKDGLTANVVSEGHGLFTYYGNIHVKDTNLTVKAGIESVGLFAETYDYNTDDDIQSAVTIKDSTVKLTTELRHGVYCGTGGILVENTKLTTETDKNPDGEGYSLYTYGPLKITGDDTVIKANDGFGIATDDVLTVEGGKIEISSTDTALYGWDGVDIRGGIINAKSAQSSAIFARGGKVNINGANTKVTAISDSNDAAAIQNSSRYGEGILIDADVTATNMAGYTPVEGFKQDNGVAISLGDGIGAYNINNGSVKNADIYNVPNERNSYFVLEGNDTNTAVTGTLKFCKHAWGEPSWTWNQDNSEASAEFTCTKDASHKITKNATVASNTIPATCGKDGKTVFTASVTLGGVEYTDEIIETIKATGNHTYKDGKCTVCGHAEPGASAETGDNSNLILLIVVMLLAATGTGSILRKRMN